MIYSTTTKEQVQEKVSRITCQDCEITKLEDEIGAVFQIRVKAITLNEMLELGIAIYNPRISQNNGKVLITFMINAVA